MDFEDTVAGKVFGAGLLAVVGLGNVCEKAVKKVTGKSLMLELGRMEEKDEKLREEHPWKWVGKKILWGTIKGITGASFHKD